MILVNDEKQKHFVSKGRGKAVPLDKKRRASGIQKQPLDTTSPIAEQKKDAKQS